jgi:signal transduction histidine kinase/CheY-like chemotaxis protein
MNPQGIFHSLFEPAIICNFNGEIQVANSSFATLFNKTTKWFTRKKPSLEAMFPNQHKALKKLIHHNQKKKDEQLSDEINDVIDGNEFYFVAKCVGMGENYLVIFQDFSIERRLQISYKDQVQELKELNDKLMEINHITRMVTSTLSQKIRTPLSGAVLALEKLNTSIKEQKTEINVRDIAFHLEEIASISRKLSLMNGESTLQFEKCNVVDFISETINNFKRLHLKNSTFRFELKIDSYFQHTDFLCSKEKLQQCFFELFKNAIEENQFKDESHHFILIRLKKPKSHSHHFEISILNKGERIPREIERKLFSPFFSTKHGHLGSGLSMIKNVLPQMGGAVHYQNDTLDYVEFIITLPMMNEVLRKAKNESTVYFITDSSPQMALFTFMMEENRLPFVCFDDIKMALSKLQLSPSDILIIDYDLKSYNGVHLARHMRQKVENLNIALLVDPVNLSKLLENQQKDEHYHVLLKPLYINHLQKLLKKRN